MRALVAGAAGFLGSHLCDRLRRDAIEVFGLDNFDTGTPENIAHLEGDAGFSLFEHDITRPVVSAAAGPLDVIFNLASPASPCAYRRDPLYTLETNYVGTRNLLELARENGATILQASTSEVYGDPTIHPQVESYWGNANCFGVRGCDEEGKRVAETLMLEYARSQTRSFCYVDDLVDGLVKMAASEPSFTGPVNLGSRTELTVLETAGLIKQMTGSSSPTVFKACRPTIRGSASRTSASPSPNSAGVHECLSQRVSRGPSNISKASSGVAPNERAVSCEHRVSPGSSSD